MDEAEFKDDAKGPFIISLSWDNGTVLRDVMRIIWGTPVNILILWDKGIEVNVDFGVVYVMRSQGAVFQYLVPESPAKKVQDHGYPLFPPSYSDSEAVVWGLRIDIFNKLFYDFCI